MSTTIPSDISLDGLNFTRGMEGRALRAYQDFGGVWTIGYGLTNMDKNLPFKIAAGTTIDENQAEWYLVKSIRENYLPASRKALDGGTYQFPQGALDAAIDFNFNTGAVARAPWPKLLGQGDLAGAKASLMTWTKQKGVTLAGLVRRRNANYAQATAGDYGHLTGPIIVEPNASGHQTYKGTAALLTAFPVAPENTAAGSVATTGVPAPTAPAPNAMRFGDKSDAVTKLQDALTLAGYPTTQTGTFDALTVTNVRAFQQAHPDLTADGTVGPATTAALDRANGMRNKVTTLVKTSGPILPGAFIAASKFISANAGYVVLAVGAAIVLAVGTYTLYQHRRDVQCWINSVLGRKCA